MILASVVLANSSRGFDKEYSYLVPEKLKEAVKAGVRVIVPFGRADRPEEGFVFGTYEGEGLPGLKEILLVADEAPVLAPDLINLARWMKSKYICTYSDAVKCMLPPGTGVKSIKAVKLEKESAQGKNAEKIINALKELGGEATLEELKSCLKLTNFNALIKELMEDGIISVTEKFHAKVREKTTRAAYIARPREEIIDEIECSHIKRIQHIRILQMLLENEHISTADLIRFSNVSPGVLNTLKKNGYIEFKDIETNRDPLSHRSYERTLPLELNLQQMEVFNTIKAKIDSESFCEYLLHGVTGSGKTEVYLQLIQSCLSKGKQAIVLVPEISLTPQMVERFKGRFGDEVAVLHSRLSLGERFDQWRLIRDGKINVAVGARSAVFAPFSRLGIIIIDEEHENTYKSETTPKYHARDVARERCLYKNAILLYGSATPSVETYYKAEKGNISLLKMTERANRQNMPQVTLVDMKKELEEGNRTIFSRKLAEEMIFNKEAGQQTILFLNRRGHSSFVLCRKCGFTPRCMACSISLTYHSYDERLICHYCGYTEKKPQECPKCKSSSIRQFGTGTQRVEEEVIKHFPHFSAVRMDVDTTTYKNSHEEILTAFREKGIDVMIGTQMIAKGHDFPKVTLVGVLAADSLLNLEDFRASERTFQLLTQVAGRAGRGEIPGRVVIQTYNTEDFCITAACSHDYLAYYRQEIKLREKLGYPPFSHIGTIVLSGLYDRMASSAAFEVKKKVEAHFKEMNASGYVLGPSRAPLSKIRNKFRWRIVIKCRDEEKLNRVLREVSDEFHKSRNKIPVELSVDLNPVNML
ncbi:MAG: primosomal protein N' [Clostridia bacterium]|nr:primosomal protein N' [Clostridia bacterium]